MKGLNPYRVVGSSIIGELHQKNNIPCQDSCKIAIINDKWGIAVVSDGAGSASNSNKGSLKIVQFSTKYFFNFINANISLFNTSIIKEDVWRKISLDFIFSLRKDLQNYSLYNSIEFHSLAATIILVLFSPSILLFMHIGDGRAGYRDSSGCWHAALIPTKGEEANTTVFVTSCFPNGIYDYIETKIVANYPTAFCLLSDGMEKTCFEVNIYNYLLARYEDTNIPYGNFLDPCVRKLIQLYQLGASQKIINAKWKKYLTDGTDSIKRENDDKTLILGFNINSFL